MNLQILKSSQCTYRLPFTWQCKVYCMYSIYCSNTVLLAVDLQYILHPTASILHFGLGYRTFACLSPCLSPCLSKTGPVVGPYFSIFGGSPVGVRSSPPVNGLEFVGQGHRSKSQGQKHLNGPFNRMALRVHWCLQWRRFQGRNRRIRLYRNEVGCFQSVSGFFCRYFEQLSQDFNEEDTDDIEAHKRRAAERIRLLESAFKKHTIGMHGLILFEASHKVQRMILQTPNAIVIPFPHEQKYSLFHMTGAF